MTVVKFKDEKDVSKFSTGYIFGLFWIISIELSVWFFKISILNETQTFFCTRSNMI